MIAIQLLYTWGKISVVAGNLIEGPQIIMQAQKESDAVKGSTFDLLADRLFREECILQLWWIKCTN